MHKVPPSRRLPWFVLILCLLPAPGGTAPTDDKAPAPKPDFTRDIRPLLDRCLRCHGSKKTEAGLRLDSRDRALVGGDSGPAIVANNAAKSELIRRVTAAQADKRMPPHGKALT